MKVTIIEHEGCFGIELKAEDMADAAKLVRLGMNRTNELRSLHVYAGCDGGFSGHVVIGKSRRANNDVPRRGGR